MVHRTIEIGAPPGATQAIIRENWPRVPAWNKNFGDPTVDEYEFFWAASDEHGEHIFGDVVWDYDKEEFRLRLNRWLNENSLVAEDGTVFSGQLSRGALDRNIAYSEKKGGIWW